MVRAEIISCLDVSRSLYEQYTETKDFFDKGKNRLIVLDEEKERYSKNRLLKFVLRIKDELVIALEYDRLEFISSIPLSGTELDIVNPIIHQNVYFLSNKNTFPVNKIEKSVPDKNTFSALEKQLNNSEEKEDNAIYLDSEFDILY